MYYFTVALCWAVCAYAAPPAPPPTSVVPLEKQQPTVIPIVSQSEELEPNGTYKFSYETGNGIKREETSYDKVVPKAKGRKADSNEGGESNESDSDEIHVQKGSYSYTAPDGTVISVRYIADENGFQPIGDHIPRSPVLSSGSSAERGSKSLKPKDSAAAESAPVIASRSGEKPTDKDKSPEGSGDAPSSPEEPASKAESSTPEAPAEASTGSASTTEASTAEARSTTEPTEGSKTTGAASSTTEAKTEGTTEASTTEALKEASTTESGKNSSTTEAESTPSEASTNESSTTEAASTSPAA